MIDIAKHLTRCFYLFFNNKNMRSDMLNEKELLTLREMVKKSSNRKSITKSKKALHKRLRYITRAKKGKSNMHACKITI